MEAQRNFAGSPTLRHQSMCGGWVHQHGPSEHRHVLAADQTKGRPQPDRSPQLDTAERRSERIVKDVSRRQTFSRSSPITPLYCPP